MNKLFMDTATNALVLALSVDGQVVSSLFDLSNKNHSERLVPMIDDLLNRAGKDITDVDAFYCGSGPGSYTGVRIGVTVSKMFAYTLNKPLYELSSLAVIASQYIGKADYIIPVMDARRESVFATIYDTRKGELEELIEERLYPLVELLEVISDKKLQNVLFVGIDTPHFIPFFKQNHLKFDENLGEDFDFMALFEKLSPTLVEDVHQFSPHYRRITEAESNLK